MFRWCALILIALTLNVSAAQARQDTSLNGVWQGDGTGRQVSISAQIGGIYVAPVTNNNQTGPMVFNRVGWDEYRYDFPQGGQAIVKVLSPGVMHISYPDGSAFTFRLLTPATPPRPKTQEEQMLEAQTRILGNRCQVEKMGVPVYVASTIECEDFPAASLEALCRNEDGLRRYDLKNGRTPPEPDPRCDGAWPRTEGLASTDEVPSASSAAASQATAPQAAASLPPPSRKPRLFVRRKEGPACLDLKMMAALAPSGSYWNVNFEIRNNCSEDVLVRWDAGPVKEGEDDASAYLSSNSHPFVVGGTWVYWKGGDPSALVGFKVVDRRGEGVRIHAYSSLNGSEAQPGFGQTHDYVAWLVACPAFADKRGKKVAQSMFLSKHWLREGAQYSCLPNVPFSG